MLARKYLLLLSSLLTSDLHHLIERMNPIISTPSDSENQHKIWMGSLRRKLNQVPLTPSNSSTSIYRVPQKLRKVNDDAYTPILVSIGPFHHGKSNLQQLQVHKWLYMREFLSRTQNPETSLEDCGKAISQLEHEAMACYADEVDGSANKFSEMMFLDGCFIVELFLKFAIADDRHKVDPIFSTAWMLITVARDLLLLENQIPFRVLDTLFSYLVKHVQKPPSYSLVHFAFYFFNMILKQESELLKDKDNFKGTHLLDLLYNSFLPHSPSTLRNKEISDFIPCAIELRRAGIKFKKSTSENLFDIKFSNGELEIPSVLIEDGTESLFRNMIALEQCHHESKTYISSFASFMDSLINSSEDVELLQKKGIVSSCYLGVEGEIPVLFNTICKEVVLHDFYFSDLYREVNDYYKVPSHTWQATLRREYFSHPWAIISVAAAIFLLGLTILQSIYTVMSYYPH